jgi:hypothetical protein
MSVYRYVYEKVQMDGCMHRCLYIYEIMNGWMDGWWMDGWMDG